MKLDLGEHLFVAPPIKAQTAGQILMRLVAAPGSWVSQLNTGMFIGPLRAELRLDTL